MNKFSLIYLLAAETIVWFLLFFTFKELKLSNEIEIIVFIVYFVVIIASLVIAYRRMKNKI